MKRALGLPNRAAWVYDHAPRKRNAFVRPVVPASTPDRYGRRRLAS